MVYNSMLSDDDEDFIDPDLDLDDLDCNFNLQISSYKVIKKESLLESQMDDLLQMVMEFVSVKKHHARTLLIHYRWDINKLLHLCVERGREFLFAQAGVSIVAEHQNVLLLSSSSLKVRCEICMEDVSTHQVSTMECGHCYCNTCWTGHFIMKINEGQSRYVKCMLQCEAICDEAIVNRLVRISDTKLAEKFEKCLLESYIEDNQKVKRCPSDPHCGNVICVNNEELCEVECACGLRFCFKCLEVEHSPCSCLIWELWNQKCHDESETANWIAVHTKKCPGCNIPVEKINGCDSVRCFCGQTFCWKCGGATNIGLRHICSVYNGGLNAKTIELAKRDLNRYLHHYNHYKAHTDSLKRETQLKEKIQNKVSILKAKQPWLKEFRWVTNGISTLFRSRHVLSNSYPLAYIIFGNHPFGDEITKEEKETKQRLFEYHQEQLEDLVQRLSMFLGKLFDDLSEDEFTETRTQISTLSSVTEHFCKNMYEYIEKDLLASLRVGPHRIAPY